VSRSHAVQDEGAEVAEGSRDIRVEADECLERDQGSVHRPAWPCGEPRSALM
jgi:hypothetical protein